jgi:electron transfer flavoprotein alpha subunit
MAVLVFADVLDGKVTKSSLEAVHYGSKVAAQAGTDNVVITYGNADDADLAALGKFGASKVLVNRSVTDMDPGKLSRLVVAATESTGADFIIFSQDYTGKSVSPLVSAKLKAGMVAGAVDYPDMSNGFVVKKSVFSGKAFADVKVNTDRKIVAIIPNAIGKEEGEGTAAVEAFDADLGDSRIRVKEVKLETSGDMAPLPEAELVVSAGRGLKGPENWGIVEDLAKELGATTACSRPVADIGWRPHHEHVGQTGIAIRPNLYIAAGISGAIQHLAGVNGSKVIVVVNTDPEAPFFKAADYGVVGDAFEVLPRLTEAIRKYKAAG